MPVAGGRAFAVLAVLSIGLGSFLLFLVQPLISKAILPWFGGGTGVWTACLVFFQVALLAGNAYAHGLLRLRRAGLLVHAGLLAAALLALPITPGGAWQPLDADRPTARILLLLAAHVGLPYFLLAANSPLVQAWLASRGTGAATYRLFAVSNLASLLGLLCFPFALEPSFPLARLGSFWSFAFALFALLAALLVGATWRRPPDYPVAKATERAPAPSWRRRGEWLLLSSGASTALLAVSQHISHDVAPVPFLWVLPLAIYLLSFVLSFDRSDWYPPRWFGWASLVTLGFLLLASVDHELSRALARLEIESRVPTLGGSLVLEVQAYLTALFLVCMLCHGELARQRPAPERLTDFYLTLSLGGAVGGVFVGLVCPVVFSSYVELALTLVGGLVLALLVLLREERHWALRTPLRRLLTGACAAGLVLFALVSQWRAQQVRTVTIDRSFYGVLHVQELERDDPERARRAFYHGNILHGVQLLDPARALQPNSYYTAETGVGVAFRWLARNGPLRIGVVGLGAGALASYGRAGDALRFYELNPRAVVLARRYFTFLERSPAAIEIREGDGRLSLAREPDQAFDLLALDAFSGDAVPAHLLTLEAFELYLRHLAPRGLLAVQISNHYLDLEPVVARLARRVGMRALRFDTRDAGGPADAASSWMVLASDPAFVEFAAPLAARESLPAAGMPLWTDQWSSLLPLLK